MLKILQNENQPKKGTSNKKAFYLVDSEHKWPTRWPISIEYVFDCEYKWRRIDFLRYTYLTQPKLTWLVALALDSDLHVSSSKRTSRSRAEKINQLNTKPKNEKKTIGPICWSVLKKKKKNPT